MHMKQKKMKLTSKDVKIMFETNLQDIQLIAMNSSSADDFKQQLLRGLHLDEDVPLSPDKENLKQLILHDDLCAESLPFTQTVPDCRVSNHH